MQINQICFKNKTFATFILFILVFIGHPEGVFNTFWYMSGPNPLILQWNSILYHSKKKRSSHVWRGRQWGQNLYEIAYKFSFRLPFQKKCSLASIRKNETFKQFWKYLMKFAIHQKIKWDWNAILWHIWLLCWAKPYIIQLTEQKWCCKNLCWQISSLKKVIFTCILFLFKIIQLTSTIKD